MEVYRTPEERFSALPGFDYEPRYRRMGRDAARCVDEGEEAPVVMLHGERTWSFLYRKVTVRMLEAGHRCVLPELPGFGRSDKPVDDAWYSYHFLQEDQGEQIGAPIADWLGTQARRRT